MTKESKKELIDRLMREGEEAKQRILSEECYTTDEFSEVTNVSPEWLKNLSKEAKYLCLENEGELFWPKFQVDKAGRTFSDFDAVEALLIVKGHKPWSRYMFWTTGPVGAEEPNIDRLGRGHLRELLMDARRYMEHGG